MRTLSLYPLMVYRHGDFTRTLDSWLSLDTTAVELKDRSLGCWIVGACVVLVWSRSLLWPVPKMNLWKLRLLYLVLFYSWTTRYVLTRWNLMEQVIRHEIPSIKPVQTTLQCRLQWKQSLKDGTFKTHHSVA
jgi:hypothetical protein